MPPKVVAVAATIQQTLREEFIKWSARMVIWIIGLGVLFAMTPIQHQIVAVWRAPEAISQVQTSQAAIRDQIVALRDEVRAAAGEDRVIRQPPGQTYILEPVTVGENVVMVLTVERTTFGRSCRLTDWVPLFTDQTNVAIPGLRSGPVRRQVGDEAVRLRVEMVPPAVLIPGRVEVYLALQYDCDGSVVLDATDVVAYALQARSE